MVQGIVKSSGAMWPFILFAALGGVIANAWLGRSKTGAGVVGFLALLGVVSSGSMALGSTLLVPAEYETIEAAAEAATTGDTVLVAPGSYSEGRIEVNAAGVVVRSSGGRDVTQIHFEDSAGFDLLDVAGDPSARSVLEGFSIFGGLMYLVNEGLVIRDNRFYVEFNFDGAAYFHTRKSCVFQRNEVFYERDPLFRIVNPSGNVDATFVFKENLFVEGYGILMVVRGLGNQHVILESNTAIAVWLFQVWEPGGWTHVDVFNNIISTDGSEFGDPEILCSVYPNVSYDIRFNCLWEAAYNCPMGEGMVFADPLFCDLSGGDYTLDADSPCVGTGENGANMGAYGIGCGVTLVGEPASVPSSVRLRVWPNPATGRTHFVLGERPAGPLHIYDATGRLTESLGAVSGLVEWEPPKHLGSGVYYATMGSGDAGRETVRFVVLR